MLAHFTVKSKMATGQWQLGCAFDNVKTTLSSKQEKGIILQCVGPFYEKGQNTT